MKKAKQITFWIVVALILLFGSLFYFQNQGTQVMLFLDVLVWKGEILPRPTSVPTLMLASFAAGLVVMGVYTLVTVLRRDGRGRPTSRDYFKSDKSMNSPSNFDDFESDF